MATQLSKNREKTYKLQKAFICSKFVQMTRNSSNHLHVENPSQKHQPVGQVDSPSCSSLCMHGFTMSVSFTCMFLLLLFSSRVSAFLPLFIDAYTSLMIIVIPLTNLSHRYHCTQHHHRTILALSIHPKRRKHLIMPKE